MLGSGHKVSAGNVLCLTNFIGEQLELEIGYDTDEMETSEQHCSNVLCWQIYTTQKHGGLQTIIIKAEKSVEVWKNYAAAFLV